MNKCDAYITSDEGLKKDSWNIPEFNFIVSHLNPSAQKSNPHHARVLSFSFIFVPPDSWKNQLRFIYSHQTEPGFLLQWFNESSLFLVFKAFLVN